MPEILFISDLHLSPDRLDTIELFLRFLRDRAAKAERLYILGDLFDVWIGDDDDTPPYPDIIRAIQQLADGGTRVYFQHGNRDFLIGKRFAKAAGCELLNDPVVVDLYGSPTLLMHGDLLCTDDLPYQKFRRKARNPLLQKLFVWRSLKKRRAIAADYRRKSANATAEKDQDIMDANQQTVEDYMRKQDVQQLIHGHTHRPAKHDFQLDGKAATRWVLGEWHPDSATIISVVPEEIRLQTL